MSEPLLETWHTASMHSHQLCKIARLNADFVVWGEEAVMLIEAGSWLYFIKYVQAATSQNHMCEI